MKQTLLTMFVFSLVASFAFPLLVAEEQLVIPPVSEKVIETMKQGVPAGNWKAEGTDPIPYAELKDKAAAAEQAGQLAEALTLYERILDRSSCKESERSAARSRIKELRPKVQAANFDLSKAKKWEVLVLLYKTVDCDVKVNNETTEHAKKTLNEGDLKRIGSELGGFRDLVFQWSSGLLIPEYSVHFIDKPIDGVRGRGGFPINPQGATDVWKEATDKFNKKFDTVISFIKCGGDTGPGFGVPYAAAIYGRTHLGGAGYMMVPWADNYPFTNRGEWNGEMELHEYLHQVDDVVHQVLGYPRGTTRSSDDGRTVNDPRKDGEQEYKRSEERTWCYFYKHLMEEHMTRQIWSEMSVEVPAAQHRQIKIISEQ